MLVNARIWVCFRSKVQTQKPACNEKEMYVACTPSAIAINIMASAVAYQSRTRVGTQIVTSAARCGFFTMMGEEGSNLGCLGHEAVAFSVKYCSK